jgi:hypothetical protein
MRARLSDAAVAWQGDSLLDVQRQCHYRMNFPGSETLKIVSPF